MRRKLTLRIKSPCQENWNSFPKKGDTGFCGRCQRGVIDFTGKSDREILEIIEKSHGRICGRARTSQLRTYHFNDGSPVADKAAIFTAAILGLSPLGDAVGQSLTGKPSTEQVATSNRRIESRREKESPIIEWFSLRGTVVSEDGVGLPGANVVVMGGKDIYGAVTDSVGNYLVEYQGEKGKEVTLSFSFIGFETQVVRFEPGEYSQLDMSLPPDLMQLGGMDVCGPWWTPRSIWWSIKGVFRRG